MNRGFYTSTIGMNAQVDRLEILSRNLSNLTTNGFKQKTGVISPFHEMMLVRLNQNNHLVHSRNLGIIHQGSRVESIITDFSPGTGEKTGKMGDLFISGEGFFTLQDENGNRYYTRSGNFFVEPGGYVCSSGGMYLMGEQGPIRVSGMDFSVSRDGVLSSEGQEVDRLLITRFDDPSRLEEMGSSLYKASPEAVPVTVDQPAILQGFIEKSNVNPTREITNAIDVMRAYEMSQKLAQAHDKLVDIAIREVGENE